MSETVAGGFYRGADGVARDAHGRTLANSPRTAGLVIEHEVVAEPAPPVEPGAEPAAPPARKRRHVATRPGRAANTAAASAAAAAGGA